MPEQAQAQVSDNGVISTITGPVVIMGLELIGGVGSKLLAVIQKMLNHVGDHGCNLLVFRNDGLPCNGEKAILGDTHVSTGGVAINLNKHLAKCIDLTNDFSPISGEIAITGYDHGLSIVFVVDHGLKHKLCVNVAFRFTLLRLDDRFENESITAAFKKGI